MRILIADDDAVSVLALEAMLAKRGHEVTVAADGEEAWTILGGEAPPPLVILDWSMPGLRGDEICRRIRGDPRLVRSYVILLSARDSHGAVLAGLRAGADAYVTKPYQIGELEEKIAVGIRSVGSPAEDDLHASGWEPMD
jgi:DNA-binding response OmpR family regulator